MNVVPAILKFIFSRWPFPMFYPTVILLVLGIIGHFQQLAKINHHLGPTLYFSIYNPYSFTITVDCDDSHLLLEPGESKDLDVVAPDLGTPVYAYVYHKGEFLKKINLSLQLRSR